MLIYTIGHSRHNIEKFIELLKRNDINCICDVRSMPYSKYAEQFNQNNLKDELKKNSIEYLFFGDEFGARRKEPDLYTNGKVDFEKVAHDAKFINGIKRIEKGIRKGYKIALMCAEKDPIECHRTILVARNLDLNGFEVNHILDDGSIINQKEIDQRLLKKHFPNRYQTSIFDENETIDYLKEAYKIANQSIGFKEEGEEE